MEKPKARFQAELIVSFELPGVGWESRSSQSGSQSQLPGNNIIVEVFDSDEPFSAALLGREARGFW